LEKASANAKIPFTLEWMPFFLNPTGSMPDEGEGLMEHLSKKYGAGVAENFMKPGNHLSKAGAACGVSFDNTRKIFTTARCHSLMGFVKEKHGNDKANELMSLMFSAYFEQAKQVNQISVLKELYETLGLSWSNEAEAALQSDSKYSKQVEMEDKTVKMQRISGVPFFILERNDGSTPIAFSGAQPVEVIQDALEECSED
jgi:predicted DsbA family dithiol-disulfide isomerase